MVKSDAVTTSINGIVKVQGELVNVNAIVNFAQIVTKAAFLMTVTQYNSIGFLIRNFKELFLEEKNDYDELINITTKAEERSMI